LAPKYYNFATSVTSGTLCYNFDNSHPLPGGGARSRGQDLQLLHFSIDPPHQRDLFLRRRSRGILNFLEIECDEKVRRDSELPRPAGSTGNRCCNFRMRQLLRPGAHCVCSFMVARDDI